MRDFWDYIELKYRGEMLCYMNTYSFIANIKTKDIYVKFTKDIK